MIEYTISIDSTEKGYEVDVVKKENLQEAIDHADSEKAPDTMILIYRNGWVVAANLGEGWVTDTLALEELWDNELID